MVSSYREPGVINRIREQAAKYSKRGVVRIFGSVPIPTVEFCGTVPPKEICNVFASSGLYVHCADTVDDMVLVADHYNLPTVYVNDELYKDNIPKTTYNDTAKKLDSFFWGK